MTERIHGKVFTLKVSVDDHEYVKGVACAHGMNIRIKGVVTAFLRKAEEGRTLILTLTRDEDLP